MKTATDAKSPAALPAGGPKPAYSVSVRALVEFVLRTGSLGGGRFTSPRRALEGTRGQQRLQKSRPAGYETEVALTHRVETPEIVLQVKGRIDGLLMGTNDALVEEIKTTFDPQITAPDPLHWAQVKFYAAVLAEQRSLERVELVLTYLNLETETVTDFRETVFATDLAAFARSLLDAYLEWLHDLNRWIQTRNRSIRALAFPFPEYRAGQRLLAVAAYRAMAANARLFAEAPTGIGKTVSVLFPAMKALGEAKLTQIFYLTAKTVGRLTAEKAMTDLRRSGLRLRSVTLSARDRLCVRNGEPCDLQTCPLALGYYDRLKPALRAALDIEALTSETLVEVAARHQVCPYALSLDAARWVDAIICDYNYVFDPSVYLKSIFDDEAGDYAFLIDEAHNLADRAREMFSAELEQEQILAVRRAILQVLPQCAKALNQLSRRLGGLRRHDDTTDAKTDIAEDGGAVKELPEAILTPARSFLEAAEAWLVRNQPADFGDELMELYFGVTRFLRVAELYDSRFVTLVEGARRTRVRLFCVDPAFLLRKALERGRSAIFFSATLTPIDYFRAILGGDEADKTLRLGSPFPPDNFKLLAADRVATHFKGRESTYGEVAALIATLIRGKRGNYLVYFPSYKYLQETLAHVRDQAGDWTILEQTPRMSERERAEFIAAFHTGHDTSLVGFAVMGGIFGEGIDLVGERLVGAVIVGVGLPQICLERDVIRSHFDARELQGFNYAYAFPGFNRVLQAAGRVIRSETDRGVVLLIDTRFRQARFRQLFPAWWSPHWVKDKSEVAFQLETFWETTARTGGSHAIPNDAPRDGSSDAPHG